MSVYDNPNYMIEEDLKFSQRRIQSLRILKEYVDSGKDFSHTLKKYGMTRYQGKRALDIAKVAIICCGDELSDDSYLESFGGPIAHLRANKADVDFWIEQTIKYCQSEGRGYRRALKGKMPQITMD